MKTTLNNFIEQGNIHSSKAEKIQKTITINKQKETINYYNLACAMDTETSSFVNDSGEKVALMYCHQ